MPLTTYPVGAQILKVPVTIVIPAVNTPFNPDAINPAITWTWNGMKALEAYGLYNTNFDKAQPPYPTSGGAFVNAGSYKIQTTVTNGIAIQATGNGAGLGVFGVGGATGRGGRFEAGGGNANGVEGLAAGTGAGVRGIGGTTGPGGSFIGNAGDNSAIAILSEGAIRVSGSEPAYNADPGNNNVVWGANTIKAWATINNTYAIQDGYNIASVTNVLGDIYAVAFVRPMANANYGVKVHVHGGVGYSGAHNGTKTTTGFQFVLFKTDTLATGFGTATEAYIEVTGRQ